MQLAGPARVAMFRAARQTLSFACFAELRHNGGVIDRSRSHAVSMLHKRESQRASLPPVSTGHESFHAMLNPRFALATGMLAALFAVQAVPTAQAGLFFNCHQAPACCPAPEPVCCPEPPPVKVTWCVVDPVTCCKYSVEACVPACCEGIAPRYVGCKPGIFGRKILTYKFDCCEHCVDVVITKFGRTIVRD